MPAPGSLVRSAQVLSAADLVVEAGEAVEAAARIGGDGRGGEAPRPVHGEAVAVAVVLREHVVGPIRGGMVGE